MSSLNEEKVEEWLDDHPEAFLDYFFRKIELPAVNAWLVTHGFSSVTHFEPPADDDNGPLAVTYRRALARRSGGAPISEESTAQRSLSRNGQHFTTSKVYLRKEFAKSKHKTVYRTHEPSTFEPSGSRRDSVVDARKCNSLPPASVNMLSVLIESKVKLPKDYPSHDKETKKNIRESKGENAFLLDIIRDITMELDITGLSVKAAENIAILLNSDGAKMYLIEKLGGSLPVMVSRQYHVQNLPHAADPPDEASSDLSEALESHEIRAPWGAGILGHVAETGETVNLKVATEDPRFDIQYDTVNGLATESLLCTPVKNASGEIIAVVQVVNKNKEIDDGYFTDNDISTLNTYLEFVGIGITNARIISASRQEYERNRKLLEVVHDLFEQQTSLEDVMLKIIERVQKLIACSKVTILLLEDTPESPKYARLFELVTDRSKKQDPTAEEKERSGALRRYLVDAAEKVVKTGHSLNIAEVFDSDTDQPDGGSVVNLLVLPVRNSQSEIIGVANLIDKADGAPFDNNDEQILEAFTIFCGLGIHNTIMYTEIQKAMARQKVSLEVLSYHATASTKEVEGLVKEPIVCADDLNLYSLTFDDFSLDPDEMVKAAASMFYQLDLVKRFSIEKDTLYRFLVSVKKNYRDVPYHNWRHAFNVSQFMFAILMACDMKDTFSELEVLGMFVGCLCHDLDHRGTNNAFQQKSQSALVLLYGTTNTMEHHHFNHAVMILSAERTNIFSGLSPEEYSSVMQILKRSILATDLSVYFENRARFFELVKTSSYSWDLDDHRELLISMLMTASDLAASCKPWEVQKRVAQLVTSEFFKQGDKERDELHLTPQPLMDRERRDELPQLQVDWMNDVCIPLYEALGEMNPKFTPMCDGAIENRKQWQKIVDGESRMTWDLPEENP